ncbi:MAG: tetratricopeptide repeat protein [Opitutae bacterium]
MRSKAIRGILIAGALSALSGGAWWWQRATTAQRVVSAALPLAPAAGTRPAVWRDQFVAAEAEAHSLFQARRGLAKLSRLYHANGFLTEALRCYEGLELLEPAAPRWPHLHASILAGYGEVEAAMALWQRVGQLAPEFLPAQLRLGDCQLKSNRPAEAAATYTAVLHREPRNPYALLGLARLDFEAQRWDQAQARLESVVEQSNYTLGYDLIVTLYEHTGQPERANAIRGASKASGAFRDPPDAWLDDLMDVCFDPYRLALTAGFLARNGDPAQAVLLLERAIAYAPTDVPTRFQLGTLSVTQGNFSVAREQLEQCTRLAPDFADGWAHLSALQEQLGETSAAAQTLTTGLSRCPASPGLHLMRARRSRQAGAIEQSIADYRESIRLRPTEAEAFIELAYLLIKLGNSNEAVRLLQQSLVAEPANPLALSTLTFHAILSGDQAAALHWFAQVRHQPRVPPEEVGKLRAAFQERFGRPVR